MSRLIHYVGNEGFVCVCNLSRPVTVRKPTALAIDLQMPLIFVHSLLDIILINMPTLSKEK